MANSLSTWNDAGRVGFVDKGVFSAITQYEQLDIVRENGATYYARQDTVGNAPASDLTPTTYWMPLSSANCLIDDTQWAQIQTLLT